MRKITKRLIKMANPVLDGGEELLVGVRVNLKGTAIGSGFQSLGSVGGMVYVAGLQAGDAIMKEGQEQAEEAEIPFDQTMAFGLTQKRIIIWNRSSFSGRPKEIIGELDRKAISKIDFEDGKLFDMMTVHFGNGKTLELESVKIDNGEEFAAMF